MKIRFQSASHAALQPNYRVRWYKQGEPAVIKTQFWGGANAVPSTSPQIYELGGVEKPAGPHTVPYVVTVTAEASTGNSPESAASAAFTLAPPDAPTNVEVIDPAL